MTQDRIVSNRTRALAFLGVAVTLAGFVVVRAGIGGTEAGRALVASVPAFLTAAGAAASAIWAAFHFGRGEGLRRQWLLIGLGMAALFLGDLVYSYMESIVQSVPWPSVADVFYLLSFPLLCSGLVAALVSFRHSVSLVAPLLLGAATSAVATVALWSYAFAPVLGDTEASAFEKFLSLAYPVGDLWLLLFPGIAVAVILSRFAGGRLAWPWWAIVLGVLLIAFADSVYGVMAVKETYVTGAPIDMGWWLGYAAIGVGASLLVDVQVGLHGRRHAR